MLPTYTLSSKKFRCRREAAGNYLRFIRTT